MRPPDPDTLLRELQAVPRDERLDWLAALPYERRTAFKRILPREDLKKLNERVDHLERERRKPTVESWLAEARAGRASSPDAMIEVLKEVADRLRPQDAQWIDRIEATASAGGYSRRQRAVIEGIYAKYFVQ